MPYKIGGGNKLQWYNQSNGEYDEHGSLITDNNQYKNESMKRLYGYVIGFNRNIKNIDFPKYDIHDHEYCELFVKTFKKEIKVFSEGIPIEKCRYLLTPTERNDKSAFLYHLGYDLFKERALFATIYFNVDFNNAEFRKIDKYGLRIKVSQSIYSYNSKEKAYTVDTIWMLDEDLHARFITMIIGGKKYGH